MWYRGCRHGGNESILPGTLPAACCYLDDQTKAAMQYRSIITAGWKAGKWKIPETYSDPIALVDKLNAMGATDYENLQFMVLLAPGERN